MKYVTSCLLTLLLGILTACQENHEKEKTAHQASLKPVEVEVLTVEPTEALKQTEVVGTVQAVDRAIIAAKVTGTIEEIPVVLGSEVKQGDLLVKISAGEISAKVIQAQAQLEQARRNLEREEKLLKQNAATAESVKSLKDMYRVAEAVHKEAKTVLGYATITAPFDGLITSKKANVGDLATPGTPLLQLEDSKTLQVVTSVPETLVLEIQPGDSLAVFIPAAKLDIQGTVAEIAPAADPLSRTAEVKINIEDAPQLRSGQFARVALPGQFARVALPGQNKDTLFVPASAVIPFGQMDKLFVVNDNRAELRLVRTGAAQSDHIEILAGLEPGEMIITTNNTRLVDGQPLIVKQ